MKIPSPQEVGLPEKFQSWRSHQEQSISAMMDTSKRAVAICDPTGSGKTVSYIAAAILSGESTCIVTESRGLQDQLMRDFGSIGLVDIRGRNNYQCGLRPDDERYSCDIGRHARCPYYGSVMCPSSQAEMRAAVSRLVVTNYDKWTSSRKYGQGMNHFTQVVFDEGHCSFDALARAMQVEVNNKEIEDTLKIEFPDGSDLDNMHVWKQWASNVRAISENEMVVARRKIINDKDPKMSLIRHYHHMRNLTKRMGVLTLARAKDWVIEQVDKGYRFDPIRPGIYAESAILFRIPRVIVVSATLRPKTMHMLGIGNKSFNFHEFDSDFDATRCPVYWVPTMRVQRGADMGPLWVRIDQILARRQDRKGIIHTISYARQNEIMETSRFYESMIINNRGEAPTAVVEEFKAARSGTVLVSPSVGTGYDFPDDSCRYQIVCKVPFEPPTKIQKARQAEDGEYVYYRAMQYLVQAFGRDMRSEKDWSERFICDDHFGEWFWGRYKHLAPRSFHAVYKRAEILPQPIKL